MRPTEPSNYHGVTLAAGQTVNNRNFGNTAAGPPARKGAIAGTVFDDANGDGRKQSGEAALPGRRI